MLNSILLQITATTGGTGTTQTAVDTSQQAVNAAQAVTEAAPTQVSISLFEFVMKGGYIMIPIGILLFIALYVIIERTIALSKASRSDKNFMNTIKDFIVSGNIDAAKTLCKSNTSPQAAVIGKGLTRLGKPSSEIREAMEGAGRLEVHELERNMIILNIVGRIAPMFGFVGTIIGVVKIFYNIAQGDGVIQIKSISGGLYEKMITSAGGLVVGVIAFAGYHVLNITVEKIINRIESTSVDFMDVLNEPSK